MTPKDVETVYETLAVTLDAVPEGQQALFLAKLALLQAAEIGDPTRVAQLIAEAAQALDV